jgi:hypothetical protein
VHDGEHAPAEHAVVPFAFEHATPHAPQFDSVLSGVSQPLPGTKSQSPKFVLHDVNTHMPVWHEPTPFAYEQTLLHMPQWTFDVLVFVSHPLFRLLSQLAKPAAHMGEHRPLEHDVEPFAFVHVVPHMPQFIELFVVLTSQPFAYMPSQFWKPIAHDWTAHVVPLHVGVPFCTEHTLPQVPHALTLFVVAVSQPFEMVASQLP